MARSLSSRLTKLAAEMTRVEYRRLRRQYAVAAAHLSAELRMPVDVDELMAEGERFLSQPLADQLAEVDQLKADLEAEGMTWEDVEETKAALIREYRA
jgi:hypothetical protein